MSARRYDEAVSHYTTALSLNLPSPQTILHKRNKAFAATVSWKQALDDANEVDYFTLCRSALLMYHPQVIKLDPSSPWGYEMKHAALYKAGDYYSAIEAFETMFSKIAESPDLDIRRELYLHYHDKSDMFTSFNRGC